MQFHEHKCLKTPVDANSTCQLQRSAKGGSINSFRVTNYIAMRNAER